MLRRVNQLLLVLYSHESKELTVRDHMNDCYYVCDKETLFT